MEHYYVVTLLLFLNENEKRQVCVLHRISFYWVNTAGEFPRRAEMVTSSSTPPFQLHNDETASSPLREFRTPESNLPSPTCKVCSSKKGTLSSRSEFFSSGKKVYSLFIPIRGQSYSGWCKGNQYKWPLRKEVKLKLYERPDENRIWNVISRNVLFSFARIWLSLG